MASDQHIMVLVGESASGVTSDYYRWEFRPGPEAAAALLTSKVGDEQVVRWSVRCSCRWQSRWVSPSGRSSLLAIAMFHVLANSL